MALESTRTRWMRRAVTVPGMFIATGLAWVLLPLALLIAAIADTVTDRRGRFLRFSAFGLAYLNAECVGLIAAGALFLVRPVIGAERYARANFALEAAWSTALLRAGMALLGMTVEFVEEAVPGDRPLLVFCRHASLVDSLVPGAFLSWRHGTRLRYVMKRELLYDPCLDIVGQRIPNAFVQRDQGTGDVQVQAMRELAADLGPGDGVLVFPEGTRFTEAKRTRALDRVRAGDDPIRAARAEALRHLLPIRSRGSVGLLEAGEGADILFMAHRGFEGGATLGGILAGALIGRHVEIATWRVDAADVPTTRATRLAWLDAEWARMDQWLDNRMHATTPSQEGP